jgi:TRAP-type C4-dicarboxylate transport system substrate-binding protein
MPTPKFLCRYAGALLLLVATAAAASAEPIRLKLAFFSSDRSISYLAGIKPFVDAVNAEADGLISITVHSSGALGADVRQQPQLVLDGVADMAFIVPGYAPDLFPGNAVIDLPGLFRSGAEASLVYTRLIAERALRGYRDFHVIGAYVTPTGGIHSRVPIASIDDLKGKRIRINNDTQAAALLRLGSTPVHGQITRIAGALTAGEIDGAALALPPMVDYGVSRVATHHYFLDIGGAPLALIMSRNSFDALPKPAQDIIRKHSGDWVAKRFNELYAEADDRIRKQLQADPKRKVVIPSPSDSKRAQNAFRAVIEQFMAADPRNENLVRAAENEIAKLRSNTELR